MTTSKSVEPSDLKTKVADFISRYRSELSKENLDYFLIHEKRLTATLEFFWPEMVTAEKILEVGSYGFFHNAFEHLLQPKIIDVTIFDQNLPVGKHTIDLFGRDGVTAYNVDLERDLIDCQDESYDTLIFTEVLEHFTRDPMFFLHEANRILSPGGRLLITTPNVSAACNIERILWRQIPNTYYYYRKDGSTDRHNLEYGPDLLVKTLAAAGFSVGPIKTEYCWSEPNEKIERLLQEFEYPLELRGDDLLAIAYKSGQPVERHPDFLYI